MSRLKVWISQDVLKFSMRFIFIICLNFEKKKSGQNSQQLEPFQYSQILQLV